MTSSMLLLRVTVFLVTVTLPTLGDVYMQAPRGSNNRLNEATATRANNDRLFDSQNNNRGGYNVGDKTDVAAGLDPRQQYQMQYFQSGSTYKSDPNGNDQTYLGLEWTAQHGCGGDDDDDVNKQNCFIVLQYMCENMDSTMRDGVDTTIQTYIPPVNLQETKAAADARRAAGLALTRGLQESFDWYDKCNVRQYNAGLFLADQQLGTNPQLGYTSAIFTRQNNGGNRRGFECPEERDYYPYWHPTAWKDIAVLAENASLCSYFKANSFNVKTYDECVEKWITGERKHYSRYNNQVDCRANGGTWTTFYNYLEKYTGATNQADCERNTINKITYKWALPYDSLTLQNECLLMLDAPDCIASPWSRVNHLGNGRFGQPNNYTWTLPYFPSGTQKQCVLRLRYNISTDDYHPYSTDSSKNGGASPVQNNPKITVQPTANQLQLAINTAQFGRTFQDRSHLFYMVPRPQNAPAFGNKKMYNLNVRGKRGNIVQTFPAVEYDFFPNPLSVTSNDLVYIQWTGSNTHNNNPDGGDGQTGDAGQGTGGTDRNNIVELRNLLENFPVPFENSTMWTNTQIVWAADAATVKPEDIAVNMASSGFFACLRTSSSPACTAAKAADGGVRLLDNLLNNAPASYPGAILRFPPGVYYFMCTRNNNFSNRSQKGTLIVRQA